MFESLISLCSNDKT